MCPTPPSSPDPSDADPRPTGFPAGEGQLDRALGVVRWLREHCDWDRRQTAESLVPHLLEEAHETVEAIRSGDPEALRDELGDLLLNLAFQVVVAEEAGGFDAEAVIRSLEAKMVRRHPHLFAGGTTEPDGGWEARKARAAGAAGLLDSLPRGLPTLLRAHRIQEKVAGVGFDWEDAAGALAKVREEIEEVEEARRQGTPLQVQEEVGDLLFAVVNYARLAGAPAVPALEGANRKFEGRFRAVEAEVARRGWEPGEATLEELDAIWDEVKARERRGGARGGGEPGEGGADRQ